MSESINFNEVSDLYDFYVKVDFDIPFFLNETKLFRNEILELMCGTGRVSIPLLSSGKKMTCVDYSRNMLDVFAEKIKNQNWPVELIQMDVTSLQLNKKFGMIILPFHSFTEILSIEKQYDTLESVSQHLIKDGIFILTLQNPKTRLKNVDGIKRSIGRFPVYNDQYMIISYINSYNENDKIVTGFQYYEIFNQHNKLIETRKLAISFKPISDHALREMIRGMDLQVVEMYGDYSYGKYYDDTSEYMIYEMIKK